MTGNISRTRSCATQYSIAPTLHHRNFFKTSLQGLEALRGCGHVEENPAAFNSAAVAHGLQCHFYKFDATAADAQYEQCLSGGSRPDQSPANPTLGQHQTEDHGRLGAF